MSTGGITSQPSDPQAIRDFLSDKNSNKVLVWRKEYDPNKRKYVEKFVYVDKLSLPEKAQALIGRGNASARKIIKELVKQGIYRDELGQEVSARQPGGLSSKLNPFKNMKSEKEQRDSLVAQVVFKHKGSDEMRNRLIDAFQLDDQDKTGKEAKKQIALNLLKLGVTISSRTDCWVQDSTQANVVKKQFFPLHIACREGWSEVISLLLKDLRSESTVTLENTANRALETALKTPNYNLDVVRALLGGGAKLFQSQENPYALFDKLIAHPDKEAVKSILKMLIDKGSLKIQDPNRPSLTPLFMRAPTTSIGQFLLEEAAKQAQPKSTPLLVAIRTKGATELIKTWCKNHPEDLIHDRGRERKSPLAIAKFDNRNPDAIVFLEQHAYEQVKKKPGLITYLTPDMRETVLKVAQAKGDTQLVRLINEVSL